MKKFSIVISAWNAADNLVRTLSSVRWADEIVLVDNASTDATAQIARKFGVKIFRRPNNPMLNVNKNFGFNKATGDWVLSLDADEEVPKTTAAAIAQILSSDNSAVGYWLPRQNIIFGKWIKHGLWWPDKQLRLFMRGRGQFPCKHVHEYLAVDGQTAELDTPLIHYNYESISQFIYKMDYLYTPSEVAKLSTSSYQLAWYDAIRFPVSDFLKIYLAQEGYRDGLHGLVLAMLQAWYAFIVFAKLWEKQSFKEYEPSLASVVREFKQAAFETKHWVLTAQIKNATSIWEQIWLKIKRRYDLCH